MALTLGAPTLPTATRNTLADDIDTLVGTTGFLVLIESATDLVRIPFNNPAFGAASVGVITLQGVPLEATAIAGSATTPTDYEIRDAATGTVVASGSVSGTGPITTSDTVSLSSLTWTQPAS